MNLNTTNINAMKMSGFIKTVTFLRYHKLFLILNVSIVIAVFLAHQFYVRNNTVYLNDEACYLRIESFGSAQEAGSFGDAHFGGDLKYDLGCAEASYKRAIAIDGRGYDRAWYQLGRIDFLRGEFNAAQVKFKKQIEFFGDTIPNVHYMIGLTSGYSASQSKDPYRWKMAEDGFVKYLEFFPDCPWGATDLAWVFFAQGKYKEMEPVIEHALMTTPESPWLNNMYGLMLLNTDRQDLARPYFEKALEASQKLTPEEWGRAYPGNDPRSWGSGLNAMIKAIEHNLQLSYKHSSSPIIQKTKPE